MHHLGQLQPRSLGDDGDRVLECLLGSADPDL